MRISSKVVVPPPCRRKSQAMSNTIGSDSEMQGSNPSTTRGTGRGGGPEPDELRRKISRLARPWRRTGPFAPRGDLGGLPLSQLAQGSSDMSF